MVLQFLLGDFTPAKNLEHFFMGVEQNPRTDARLAVVVDEMNGPIALHHVAENAVSARMGGHLGTFQPLVLDVREIEVGSSLTILDAHLDGLSFLEVEGGGRLLDHIQNLVRIAEGEATAEAAEAMLLLEGDAPETASLFVPACKPRA